MSYTHRLRFLAPFLWHKVSTNRVTLNPSLAPFRLHTPWQCEFLGGDSIGFWSGLAMVVAAPFVVAGCAAGALGAVAVGLPAAAAVLLIEEIENS